MNKKVVPILVVVLVLVAMVYALVFVAIPYGWKEFNRSASDAGEMPVKEQVSATAMMNAFLADEAAATVRFVGTSEQVIHVDGTIRAIEPSAPGLANVVLATDDDMAGVVCEFEEANVPENWKEGMVVDIKGVCTGMLLDVILVRCVAVK